MFRIVSVLVLFVVLFTGTAHAQSDIPQRTWREWYVILQDRNYPTPETVILQAVAVELGLNATDPRVRRYAVGLSEVNITAPFLAAKYLEAGYRILDSLSEFYVYTWYDYNSVYCVIRPHLSETHIQWLRDTFINEAKRRAIERGVESWRIPYETGWWGHASTCDTMPTPTPTPVPNVLEQAATLMASTPTGEGLMISWQELGTIAEWQVLREGVYAHYDPNRERIVFNQRYYEEFSVDLLAAVLAHEIVHAYLHQVAREGRPLASKEGCEAEEVLAYAVGLVWWYERFGIAGKPNPNQLDQGQNHMLEIWLKAAASQVQAGLSDEEATTAVLALIRKEAEGTHHIGYCDTYPSIKRN